MSPVKTVIQHVQQVQSPSYMYIHVPCGRGLIREVASINSYNYSIGTGVTSYMCQRHTDAMSNTLAFIHGRGGGGKSEFLPM